MTPMFSAYVVVGEPPTEDAMTVPNPSAAIARPMYGSRLVFVISATALTWPVFSAMRAMTPGSTSRIAATENDGAWMPTISLPSPPIVDDGGRPNHGCAERLSKLVRKWVVTLLAPASKEVIWPKTLSKIHEMM